MTKTRSLRLAGTGISLLTNNQILWQKYHPDRPVCYKFASLATGISYNSADNNMKINAAWKLTILVIGITLTAIMTFSILSFKTKPDCDISQGQTVVKWKDMYWFPCKYWWNGFCIWPPQRRHSTYKVTVKEGIPLRDEKGKVIIIAGGKIRDWQVYDATAWNELQNYPRTRNRYQNYEPIAENEYVVVVQTRYWLFHNVDATLRICLQAP